MAEVIVVGGGLAGMVTALRLLERGYEVSLYDESETRLGGKAGANKNGGDYNDHGYHIFPAWYVNTWQLVEDLGIGRNFVDFNDLHQMLPLESDRVPRLTTLRGITSFRYLWRNLRSGFIPIPDMFLFFYAALDLASQPDQQKADLDQLSITGFLRSRFYRTQPLETLFHELVLKAITVPGYNVSAMTAKKVMRFWLKTPLPFVRILRNNLQTSFIEPIQQRLQELGCDIHFAQRLVRIQTDGSRVTKLQFQDQGNGSLYDRPVEVFVLAIPPERVAKLLDDDVYAAAPNLSKVLSLHSQPMAAFDIYFSRKLPYLPREHVMLTNSHFGLSFIDVSRTWPDYDASVLQVIASDFIPLQTLSPDKAAERVIEELMRFLPFERTDIKRCVPQPHLNEPLFINDEGAWHYRPKVREEEELTKELTNLYLAGDYCRVPVDLTSMEAAISSGLQAAAAIVGEDREEVRRRPPEYSERLLALAKRALMPIAALVKLVTLIRDRIAANVK
jgi:protoporphyrinogen oxidase